MDDSSDKDLRLNTFFFILQNTKFLDLRWQSKTFHSRTTDSIIALPKAMRVKRLPLVRLQFLVSLLLLSAEIYLCAEIHMLQYFIIEKS